MPTEHVPRKDLDNERFLNLRRATERIAGVLNKRLNAHLSVLQPLFAPPRVLGIHVRSTMKDDVPGSDRAFAKLQHRYASVCERPFNLRKELTTPLPPISNKLECTPYQYVIQTGGDEGKQTTVTSPTRYVLSYGSEFSLNRLREVMSGTESRRSEEMKESLVSHLCVGITLEKFPALKALLEDLRYEVETLKIDDLGGLPVVMLTAPLKTFLPPDDFIHEVTQLSGIPAFQEIIDPEAIENMHDPLKDTLRQYL